MTHHIWKRPSLSELTLIIFNMELTHLGLKVLEFWKINSSNNIIFLKFSIIFKIYKNKNINRKKQAKYDL